MTQQLGSSIFYPTTNKKIVIVSTIIIKIITQQPSLWQKQITWKRTNLNSYEFAANFAKM